MSYETYTGIWYDFISCGIAFGNGEPEGPDFRQGGGATPEDSQHRLILEADVLEVGPENDVIPALNDPILVAAGQNNFLEDQDWVLTIQPLGQVLISAKKIIDLCKIEQSTT